MGVLTGALSRELALLLPVGWADKALLLPGCRAISIPITITITISVYTVESDREIPEASIPSCKILLVLYEFFVKVFHFGKSNVYQFTNL